MKRRVSENKYEGLLAPWKVRLIISRAKRLGFRRHDLEDVQQEVVLEVVAFRFDPAKGASESTPLTKLIDNRLKAIRRKAARYAARITSVGDAMAMEEASLFCEETVPLRLDVMTALASMTGDEIAVCIHLIHGLSVRQIARELGRGWHSVNRIIIGIRERFRTMGLEA
jgi:DNA-directed RNA polymerase specialized sigma24 family protein